MSVVNSAYINGMLQRLLILCAHNAFVESVDRGGCILTLHNGSTIKVGLYDHWFRADLTILDEMLGRNNVDLAMNYNCGVMKILTTVCDVDRLYYVSNNKKYIHTAYDDERFIQRIDDLKLWVGDRFDSEYGYG